VDTAWSSTERLWQDVDDKKPNRQVVSCKTPHVELKQAATDIHVWLCWWLGEQMRAEWNRYQRAIGNPAFQPAAAWWNAHTFDNTHSHRRLFKSRSRANGAAGEQPAHGHEEGALDEESAGEESGECKHDVNVAGLGGVAQRQQHHSAAAAAEQGEEEQTQRHSPEPLQPRRRSSRRSLEPSHELPDKALDQ